MDIFIENLTKEYGIRRVLDIDKFQISSGSMCGIIGSNGSGKSTLMNIIGGLLDAIGGEVSYYESGNTELPLRRMTMVFQKPYMLSVTVEKNIAYPLKLRGWKDKDIALRTAELMEELGLTDLRRQKGWNLSGGETQKVALARALSFRPELLLLDEPTASVDPSTTADIEKILKKINEEEKTTVLIISHNLAQVKRLCKEVLFLDKGKKIEFGQAIKIMTDPDQELTRRFIAGELLI